jgi:hypothetical protein
MKYSVMARVTVDISRTIAAESLAEAVEVSKQLQVKHFVQPAKGADDCFNDYNDFEVYGVFKE